MRVHEKQSATKTFSALENWPGPIKTNSKTISFYLRQIYHCYAFSSFSFFFFFLLMLFDLFVFIFLLLFSSSSLANLAKWLCVHWRTKCLCVRIPLLSLKLQIWCLLWARSSLTFRQTIECGFTLKLARDMIITYSY